MVKWSRLLRTLHYKPVDLTLPGLPHWMCVHFVALAIRVLHPIVEGFGIMIITKQIVLLPEDREDYQ